MEPLYAGKPLTPAERADVAAFLAGAGGRAPADGGGRLALHAGLGFAALALALTLTGRGRGRSTRARLVEAARRRAALTPGDHR
jgi:hypothetical protein